MKRLINLFLVFASLLLMEGCASSLKRIDDHKGELYYG